MQTPNKDFATIDLKEDSPDALMRAAQGIVGIADFLTEFRPHATDPCRGQVVIYNAPESRTLH